MGAKAIFDHQPELVEHGRRVLLKLLAPIRPFPVQDDGQLLNRFCFGFGADLTPQVLMHDAGDEQERKQQAVEKVTKREAAFKVTAQVFEP
jgi:hypothetical protein